MMVTIRKWCASCGRYEPHQRTYQTEFQTHYRPVCVKCDVDGDKYERRNKRRMKW